MTLFGMESLEDTPSHEMFTVSEEIDSLQRRDILKAAGQIVSTFVDVSFGKGEKRTPTSAPSDGVKAYVVPVFRNPRLFRITRFEIFEFKVYRNLSKFFMVAVQKYSLVTSQN